MTFPKEHRAKLHPTNPIERLNDDANIRLVGVLLLEQNDEWAVQRGRYMRLETMAPLSDDSNIMLSAVPSA